MYIKFDKRLITENCTDADVVFSGLLKRFPELTSDNVGSRVGNCVPLQDL